MGSASLVMESSLQGSARSRACAKRPAETVGLVGTRVGDYLLNDLMGESRTGALFHGRHAITDVQVAVEIFRGPGAGDPELPEKLVGAAKAARVIHHANLAVVIDVGSMPDGAVFVVTESLEGETLQARLQRIGRIPLFEAINLLRQMAHGLGAAHEAGLVHGGLKPSNIFLCTRKGRRRIVRHSPATVMDLAVEPEGCFDLVKLLDLGLAGVGDFAAEAAAPGTPHYASPELAEGKPAERSSDIFSLGAVFYEMITGAAPFVCDSASDIIGKSLAGVVTMPSRRAPGVGIDGQIDDMILKCLKKTPRLRFANTTELCEALDACVTDRAFLRDANHPRPMTVRKPPVVPMATKTSRAPGVAKSLPPPIPHTHPVARGRGQPPPIPKTWKTTHAKRRSASDEEKSAFGAAAPKKIALPDRLIALPKFAGPSAAARVTPPPIPLPSALLTEIVDQV